MSNLLPVFKTDRMVHEYFSDCYQYAAKRYDYLIENKAAKARELALWKHKVIENWDMIEIVKIDSDGSGSFEVGDNLRVTAQIKLGKLGPDDVSVELYTGVVDAGGSLIDANPLKMECKEKKSDRHIFEGVVPLSKSGKIGYSLRIVPEHPDSLLSHNHMLIKWA